MLNQARNYKKDRRNKNKPGKLDFRDPKTKLLEETLRFGPRKKKVKKPKDRDEESSSDDKDDKKIPNKGPGGDPRRYPLLPGFKRKEEESDEPSKSQDSRDSDDSDSGDFTPIHGRK